MTNRMIALIANPLIYVGWTVVVVAALLATYFSDPYIFAFTAIGLAWLTAAITVMGLSAVALARTAQPRTRMVIVIAVMSAVTAVAMAFGVLRTFKWA